MTTENLPSISPEGLNFISRLSSSFVDEKNLKTDNDKTIGSALVYEKIRVAVEYQEEHQVLKNAMSRILRRQYTFVPSITAKQLFSDLINELAWANYINPEKIDQKSNDKITEIIERYLVILKYARTGRFNCGDLIKTVIDWLACELDETLRPDNSQSIIVDYTENIIINNLDLGRLKISKEENELQLEAAIFGFLFKPDYASMQYWLIKKIYPNWSGLSLDEVKKNAQSFDPFYNKIDNALNHPYRKNYIQFVRRFIPPFVIIYSAISNHKIDLAQIKEKPFILHHLIMDEYNSKVAEARNKVWRGTLRALIFILITKISLAFIIEIPFDNLMEGSVDIVSLLVNISLPPLLMLFLGTFVKSPPQKNYKVVSDSVVSILTQNKVDSKKYPLVKAPTSTYFVFNFLYTIFSLFVLAGAIWFLLFLNFNIVSIILFFFFVSVVSFFSFRIRNIALELAMKRSRDDALTSVFELLLMPFIRIGKFFSDKFATFNPVILALDFLIEAPLKIVIKFFNSWFKFFNSKKEELGL